ncbi:MAG TPA: hypothetical protein PLO37_24350 [Candidatus Hydrogenedentes bacterium]|nr:hypothetical protein [Candidatus Hydrogenedentota bacterium]HPG69993.1 hypothetical protein [Candidatus Hydrogenedentota bacterium]
MIYFPEVAKVYDRAQRAQWSVEAERSVSEFVETSWAEREFPGSAENRRQTIYDWLSACVPLEAQGNSALMDATTLANVGRLTGVFEDHSGGKIDAFSLWDLSSFVNAVILCDHVLHFETLGLDSLSLNEGLQDPVIIVMQQPEDFSLAQEFLAHVWGGVRMYIHDIERSRGQEWNRIRRAWRYLLGDDWDLPYGCIHLESKFTSMSFVARVLMEPGGEPIGPALYLGSDDYVIGHTARCLFNLRLASLLDVPYYPNTLRLPALSALADSACQTTLKEPLVDQLQCVFLDLLRESGGYYPLYRMPFFTTAVLSTVTSPQQILPKLGQMRHEARHLRDHKAALAEAFRVGDGKELSALSRAMKDDTKALALKLAVPIVGASILAVLPSIGSLTIEQVSVVAILSAMLAVSPDTVAAFTRRILRPHFWFLANVASEAAQFLNVYEKAGSIWGTEWTGKGSDEEVVRKWSESE